MSAPAYLFPPPAIMSVPVIGETRRFPVHRVFCVGRNYEEHAKEMGAEVDREAPFYFLKTADVIVETGATIPYPPGTQNYHYEMEFVFAIGKGGFRISKENAMSHVFGYACGLDMTRRDLQNDAKKTGRPWDLSKAFEQSAIISPIAPAATFSKIGPQDIMLSQNGVVKQKAKLSDLVWSVPELIAHLSQFYHLVAGDLIYTGTPAGVGAIKPGDVLTGSITGLPDIRLTIGNPE
jgi:fumarylpyruvate hydrolase